MSAEAKQTNTVQATIIHQTGKREQRSVSTAEEFRRLLDQLHKRAQISLDGGPTRYRNQWRNDRGLWPWPNPNNSSILQSATDTTPTPSSTRESPQTGFQVGIAASASPTSLREDSSDANGRGPAPRPDLAGTVQRIRTDVDSLVQKIEPLPERFQATESRLDQNLTEQITGLRRELHAAFREELVSVTSSIADLVTAVRSRADKSEVSSLVADAIAPAEKRVSEALQRLREEHEGLVEEGEEQRRRVRSYLPGTVDELRQRLDELKRERETDRAELTKAYTRIDQLERDNAHLKESTGAVDREELDRIRKQIAKDREELESAKQLAVERDELRSQLAEFQRLEHRYRSAQEVKHADLRLEERLREAESLRATAEGELSYAREDAAKLQRRFDALSKDHYDVQQRCIDLATANGKLTANSQALNEQVAALSSAAAAHQAERERLAEEWLALSEQKTHHEQTQEAQRRAFTADALSQSEAQDRQHAERMAFLDAQYERERQRLEEQIRRELRKEFDRELEELRVDRDDADSARARLREENENLRSQLTDIRAEHVQWEASQEERTMEVARHQSALQDLLAQRDDLRAELRDTRDALRHELEAHEQKLASIEHDYQTRLAQARAEVQAVNESLAGLQGRAQGARDRLADIDRQYQDELELVRALHAERRRLEEPTTREVRVKSMTQPLPEFSAGREPRAGVQDEMQWLDQLDGRIRESEFVFPRRLLDAFHTSLKITHWSPLTVLAGMSGTGKSALSRLYAHFGGLRFLMVPVQPNWDSPQDLFGFFNHIDGTYKATPLIRALVQSQTRADENGFEDGLLLVGIDEMNLARVEYYGSELLSRWEARRDGVFPEALQIDIGHGEYEHVRLGSNVLWVGTMNEDETTQSLSDKVLERGNVITFPRPKSLNRRERIGLGKPGPWLSANTFAGWTVEPSSLPTKVRDALKAALEEMNHKLGLVQRSLSHRILQAIENYVANHPQVRAHTKDDATDKWWKRAFADQVVQKVMPKLRGLDNHAGKDKQCLDGFERILGENAEELVIDFREARKLTRFAWNSASYLEADGADAQ